MATISDCSDAGTFERQRQLLESGEYSDLMLDCQGVQFNVHRAILCTQSDYFAAVCAGPMKHCGVGYIHLHEEEPVIVFMMLHWLYYRCDVLDLRFADQVIQLCASLTPPRLAYQKKVAANPLLYTILLFEAANKFHIAELKMDCIQDLTMTMTLEAFCTDDYLAALAYLYSNATDQSLRNRFACALHRDDLAMIRETCPEGRHEIESYLLRFPEFARDVLMRCKHVDRYKCGNVMVKEGYCPRGDQHICGGVCMDVSMTELLDG